MPSHRCLSADRSAKPSCVSGTCRSSASPSCNIYHRRDNKEIQGRFAIHIKEIRGDYNNVVGLPVARLYQELKKLGVNKLIILSGDRKEIVEDTREKLEMDEGYGELLPLDKLNMVEKIKKEKKDAKTIMVGDGINDAPTLASADVAIAMGGVGSDSAIEASDSVIMDDDINKIPRAISIAKKTEVIVKENIILSLLVKAIVFILALMGVANMWIAVFADTGVSLLAVANSLRALFYKEK